MVEALAPIAIEPLQTERLDLTPLDPDADAPALHAMLADPEVHRYDTDAVASRSLDETTWRLRRQALVSRGASWAIRMRGGDPIGTVGVFADQGTPIRGVGWSLVQEHWRCGITSEAARAAIAHLLTRDGVDGLEAWVDAQNAGSLAVARSAGMTERGRLPRSYPDRVGQTVVLARARAPLDPGVFAVVPTLRVTDLQATIDLLTGLMDLHLLWTYPDPPTVAFLAVGPWSGSPGLRLEQAPCSVSDGQRLAFDVGVLVDEIGARALQLGLHVGDGPHGTAWDRRELSFELPDHHRITVSGPTMPHGLRAEGLQPCPHERWGSSKS